MTRERTSVQEDVRTEGGLLGERAAHHDFVDKIRGSLAYAADQQMAGMLHGKIVRAQSPSARIVSVDTSEARALSGVVAILTAADVPNNSISEEASGLGLNAIETPVLAAERVRYEGEPVALIAATHPHIAEQAGARVLVEYEDIPGVFDPEDALEEGAPRVQEQGNILSDWRIERGDVEEALRNADVVVEGTYKCHAVDHAYLEPEAGVGWVEGNGTITLRVSTQVIEHDREIARILALPHSKVRVIGAYMGGGFGGKEDMTVEPYLALLVWETRRPVKMVWTRQESILARPKRHPMVMRYKTGSTSDGRIVAQKIDLVADCGAYPALSPRVVFAAAVTAAGPYRVPNARIEAKAVFTNNVPNSAFRGFGAMQVVFGYESLMDRLGAAVGMSPREVRERNYLKRGDTLPTVEQVDTEVALPEITRRALDALGERGTASNPTKRIGRGFACNMQPYGRAVYFQDQASCWISLEQDGGLIVRAGVTDLGGGQAASLAQIAGEVLGVPLQEISVYIGDTALTPVTGGTFATRQLYMSGNAALKTALELRERIAPVGAELLGTDAASVSFSEGAVHARNASRRTLSLAELVKECEKREVSASHLGVFHAEGGEFDPQKGQGRTFPDYTYGTHAVVVEVDIETGEVRILRYVACHDVGRALNPLRVEGQIQGGAVQGIGYALQEELQVDQGTNMSTLFADYLIPTSLDIPDIDPIVLEIGRGKGPFGARGIGEPPIGPPAAALASAIEDAIGIRITELPMTPERVLDAIKRSKSHKSAIDLEGARFAQQEGERFAHRE